MTTLTDGIDVITAELDASIAAIRGEFIEGQDNSLLEEAIAKLQEARDGMAKVASDALA